MTIAEPRSRVVAPGTDSDFLAPSPARRLTDRCDGVIAVIVVRGDQTCSLYCRGTDGSWPSVADAKAAVEELSAQVVWRESTSGVWVARFDVNDAPISDRGSGRNRRRDDPKPTTPSARGDTYMAAQVLRGTAVAGLG
jgi:hypothetical protein